MKIQRKNSKPWNNFQRGGVEFSYGPPLTVDRVLKVKKVGVYQINVVHQIHNKSGENTPKNSNICNISFPKILIRVINQSVDRTHLDTSKYGLPPSVSCTVYTTYVKIYLRRVH